MKHPSSRDSGTEAVTRIETPAQIDTTDSPSSPISAFFTFAQSQDEAQASLRTTHVSMHIPPGQPPGYQHAAWAAAGLPAPPCGTIVVRTAQGSPAPASQGAGGGLSPAQAATLNAALAHCRDEGLRMGAAAEALLQAAERNEAFNETLHQAAASHILAQQAITALQSQLGAHQNLQQTIEQMKTRLDTIEAILKDTMGVSVTAGPSAGQPQQGAEREAEPLMKRFRALNWRAHER